MRAEFLYMRAELLYIAAELLRTAAESLYMAAELLYMRAEKLRTHVKNVVCPVKAALRRRNSLYFLCVSASLCRKFLFSSRLKLFCQLALEQLARRPLWNLPH